MFFSYSGFYFCCARLQCYPSRLIPQSRIVPRREVQPFLSEALSDPTVKNSGIFYWFFIPFYVSSFIVFFFFICFPSLLPLLLLSSVPQVLSCGLLCLLYLTGSFFDSLSVSLGFSTSICFSSNQCHFCLKLQCSLVCPVGYLPCLGWMVELSFALKPS